MYLENIPLFSELNTFSIVFRIILALLLGGILGVEREKKQRPAGFRTYVAVCLGSTLACITNIYMCQALNGTDPARIPAQVISGMGFLGAGTIIVTRSNHIKGLTTAAGLWCCATIGIAVGSGFYSGAILCTIILVVSLKSLTIVDRRFSKFNKYINLYVECNQTEFIREVLQYARKNDYNIYDLEVYPATNSTSCYVMFNIKIRNPALRALVVEDIRQLKGSHLVEEMT